MSTQPGTPAPSSSTLLPLDLLRWGLLASVLAYMPGEMLFLDGHLFPAELVLHVFAFAALALCLALSPARRADAADLCLAAYVVLGVASALYAVNGWFAVRALGLTLSSAAAFWAARRLAADGRGPALARAAALVGVAAAIPALLEAYGVLPPISAVNRAPGGTLQNRNAMAHLVVLALPLLVAFAAGARARVAAWGGAAGLALVSAALVLSRSRAGWLAAALVLVVCAATAALGRGALAGTRVQARAGLLAVALAAGAAAAVLLPNRLDWTSDRPYTATLTGIMNFEYGSGRGRVIQYGNTTRMVAAHPLLGVGPGNWTVHYPRYATPGDPSYTALSPSPTTRLPQSDWVGMAAERGVPALLLLLGVGAAAAMMGIGRLRAAIAARDADQVLAAFSLLAMLAALAVVGTTDPVLQTPTAAFLVFAAAGALLPARPRPAGEPRRAWEHAPLRYALPAAAVLAAAVPVGYAGRQAVAGRLYAHGLDTAALERATRINPGDYRAHMLLGDALARAHDCAALEPHLAAAERLFPTARAPGVLRDRCREGASASVTAADPRPRADDGAARTAR